MEKEKDIAMDLVAAAVDLVVPLLAVVVLAVSKKDQIKNIFVYINTSTEKDFIYK